MLCDVMRRKMIDTGNVQLDLIIEDYLSYVRNEKKLSDNTYESYADDLDSYGKYLVKNNLRNISKVTLKDINENFISI